MKAVYIENYGSEIILGERPEPLLHDDDLLVEVFAAGLNPVDFKIRDGKLRAIASLKMPQILGLDLAGVVQKVGSRVTKFKVGDRVFARVDQSRMGTFAEFAKVHEDHAAIIPTDMSFEIAAAIPLAALTAWQCLFDIGQLTAKQKVLIHAGAGGVGSFAIQLAKSRGAFVASTGSGPGLEIIRRLGANQIIDYKNEDFSKILKDFDLVLDTIGEKTLARSFTILKPGGRVVSIAGAPDSATARELKLPIWMEFIFWILSFKTQRLAKKFQAHYRYLFMHPNGGELEKISELYSKKALVPLIDRTYTFSEAKEAFSYLESGRAKGKLVLKLKSA